MLAFFFTSFLNFALLTIVPLKIALLASKVVLTHRNATYHHNWIKLANVCNYHLTNNIQNTHPLSLPLYLDFPIYSFSASTQIKPLKASHTSASIKTLKCISSAPPVSSRSTSRRPARSARTCTRTCSWRRKTSSTRVRSRTSTTRHG